MIICAAVRLSYQNQQIIICGARHGDCYETIHQLKSILNLSKTDYHYEEGFVDELNVFYNREKAYEEAVKFHQLSLTTIESKLEYKLYSEDLY